MNLGRRAVTLPADLEVWLLLGYVVVVLVGAPGCWRRWPGSTSTGPGARHTGFAYDPDATTTSARRASGSPCTDTRPEQAGGLQGPGLDAATGAR